MNVPEFCKPIKWWFVGGFFRSLYESPAENACLGLLLLLMSVFCLVILGGLGISMMLVFSLTAFFVLWGISHFITSAIMIHIFTNREQKRAEEYRRKYNR